MFRDPRDYQIAVLASLLGYGLLALRFDIEPIQVTLTLATVLAAQWICTRVWRLPRFDPKSALISGLSLCLLLRTDSLTLAFLAAVIAVASKFVIRIRGKHLFNPTNGAIVALMIVTPAVWVSPGQWGNIAFFAFLMACLGGLVVHRALRSDVTYAFVLIYAGLLFGRSMWLGEPLAIPLHRVQSGALLLFTFFMISDPRTTPDSRAGRMLFATLVATGAWYVQFRLFRTNGLLWSLGACSLLTPVIDLVLPGRRYAWPGALPVSSAPLERKEPVMKRLVGFASILAILVCAGDRLVAFCGFYVAKADTKIFNKASKVVIARDGDRTIMTMANDFKGDLKEFAVVIPVPTVIQKDQVSVSEQGVVDHLDSYTAPRLVEYFDPDPCMRALQESRAGGTAMMAAPAAPRQKSADALGVKIEAQYTVGEYDILILSARDSSGLETWLRTSGYRIPDGATAVLGSYIKQNMRFFVAKVNLQEQGKLGFSYLRPLQVAYESPKFMLPIRLGTVNANGPQELFAFTLTRKGRVETTNYRTVKLPSDQEIPIYVKTEFPKFYTAMFDQQVKRENMSTVFLEYAWDMNWCDPCAAEPLSQDELKKLGVFWLGSASDQQPGPQPRGGVWRPRPGPTPGGANEVFVTRLHARYDGAHFPEDLVFQETGDRTNFQGRYILRHAFSGAATCSAAEDYRRTLGKRHEQEAQSLATLTGWPIDDIRSKMKASGATPTPDDGKWWIRR
jgi:hypothetical protein